MKKLLLLTGDLAAGKSSFADILSKRYDTPYFYKDSIKELLGDTIGFSNREENLKLSRAAVDLMIFAFAELAKSGRDLILEANFRTPELERLQTLARENGYDVLTAVFRGDLEILYGRYMNRIRNENRHPVHVSTGLNEFSDFKEYLERARQETVPGNTVCINADDFSYQTDEELLSKIDRFMLD